MLREKATWGPFLESPETFRAHKAILSSSVLVYASEWMNGKMKTLFSGNFLYEGNVCSY